MSTDDGSKPLLNTRHERFAQSMADGQETWEAYLGAGYQSKTNTRARKDASRLRKRADVCARILHLRAQQTAQKTWDARAKLQLLEEIMADGTTTQADRMKALDLHNRMTGDLAPQQSQVLTATIAGAELPESTLAQLIDTQRKLAQRKAKQLTDSSYAETVENG